MRVEGESRVSRLGKRAKGRVIISAGSSLGENPVQDGRPELLSSPSNGDKKKTGREGSVAGELPIG